MRRVVKWMVGLGASILVLLLTAAGAIWMAVPVNAPWTSMLQQMGALPAWLDPPAVTADEVERQLFAANGYTVSLFATAVSEARVLRVTDAGDVLVSTPRDGRVTLLEADRNQDGVSDGRQTLVDDLRRPNGLDLAGGYLYVAEEDAVGRIEFDPQTRMTRGSYDRVIVGLPPGGNHWKKTIRFGPDGMLYVGIGSSCNVCVEDDSRRAALLRYTADGHLVDVYATGLRNSAGFDWSPTTGALYATDNGRDLLGDGFPPCELNIIVKDGFYGWPFANGANVPDPDLGQGQEAMIASAIAPVHEFRAHNAPLGITFLRHGTHSREYRHAALVALHGSWNRSTKDGYKVVSLHFGDDGSVQERDFLTGFLVDDVAIGRPADVAEGPDGSIYVSDDLAGAVYRVRSGVSGANAIAPAPSSRTDRAYDPSAVSDVERDAALSAGPATFADAGCQVCHGDSRTPDTTQVALADLGARYTVSDLVEYLATPPAPMPPYEAGAGARRALAIFLLETY